MDGSLTASTVAPDRLDEMLARYLGPALLPLLEDADVTEIYVNPQDRSVRLDTRTRGKVESGLSLEAHRTMMFLNAVAARLGRTLTSDAPRLEAELPLTRFRGSRLQGFVPPVVAGPAFVIRKPPSVIYSLADYVAAGVMSAQYATTLREAVRAHASILVAGGTSSGKTTLANALLREITDQFPAERLVLLEDTVELQCAARDYLALRTNGSVTLADLVRSALRTSPDRIIVGEVRGSEALDLLDAWATGHPGGVATVHAASAEGALLRLDRLAQRANVPSQQALIAEAVDVIVVLQGGNTGRRVLDVARVSGLSDRGEFVLDHRSKIGASPDCLHAV